MKKTSTFISLTFLFITILFAGGQTSGKIFFDHTSDLSEEGINAFNLKRAYLTYENSVNENMTYKVTYDMGKNDGGSAHTAFLKVAMLKWKTGFGNVTIGMQGMNMFKTMENTWGHRFIQTMPMDTYKFSASTDIGLGFTKSFGSLSTSALITNGGGYKNTETDSQKTMSFHAVYGESQLNKNEGFNVGASFSLEPLDVESMVENTIVMGLFSGYAGNGFRGGLEFETKTSWQYAEQIISIYGTYKISNKLSILGRLDQHDNDTDSESGVEQYIIAGLLYKVDKGLTIAPTLRMKTPEVGDAENSIVVNFQFDF